MNSSPVFQRSRVLEHRVTTRLPWAGTIRYWIESDPKHGGVDRGTAIRLVREAEGKVGLSRENPLYMSSEQLASRLLEELPCANSIEVCDSQGTGCAVHRDWP
jgi:hypothetical protein